MRTSESRGCWQLYESSAVWIGSVIGIIVAVVAAIELWMTHQGGRLMPSR
jgi:hypothetical protein